MMIFLFVWTTSDFFFRRTQPRPAHKHVGPAFRGYIATQAARGPLQSGVVSEHQFQHSRNTAISQKFNLNNALFFFCFLKLDIMLCPY